MANNKLYGLPNRIELTNMHDPIDNQKADITDDHGQGIYMNTDAIAKGNTLSVDDNDLDYEILQHKISQPKRNMTVEKKINHDVGVNGKEYRCVFIVFGGMMCALIFMVTGIAVALGVLHKTWDLQNSWEPWAPWSPCSASCDFGISLRKRNCSNGDSKAGFTDCVGDASEYQLCKTSPCNETYRLWSAWEQWSACSASCDVGLRHHRRNCNETSSSENAAYCIGDATEYQLCNDRACSVINGGWSDWLAWGTCSTTCATGLQTRHRNCSNPTPRNGGEHCFGETVDYKSCELRTCPGVDGGWSVWSAWGICSTTCEAGLQTRNRKCSNPRPNNGGEQCFGESVDYRSCNLRTCPVSDGSWSAWSSWGSCSSDCSKIRTRYCSTYNGGRQCVGNSADKENCNLAACAFTRLQIRIIGSSNRGRLEVSSNGSDWGTVCDDGFDNNDARVACRMLGYTGYAVVDSSSVVDGSGPIYLDDLDCVGTEGSLLYCKHNGWGKHNCGHGEDVGVSCNN